MKWFFGKKKTRRSWEEITAQSAGEESENVASVDNEIDDNSADDKAVGEQPVDENESTKKNEEKRQKIDQMIENLNFDATVYYGWGDDKFDTWMQKLTKVWNVVASIVWFVFGSVTFAPILFTANKIDKFLNDKKKSLLISTIIHLVVVIFLIIVILF